MTPPTVFDIDPVISATWPAASIKSVGPFTARSGGGGQRACAATANGPVSAGDIAALEQATEQSGETLVRVRGWEGELDQMLDGLRYEKRDPTHILVGPVAPVADRPLPLVSAFAIWPPLAIMDELWEENDIGPDRRANMVRVAGPKIGLLGRGSDQPGGVGFVATHGNVAMIHAVAVSAHLRRQKIAENMMVSAGKWAQDVGVDWLATLCTYQNTAALSLYESFGMKVVGTYHYRAKKTARGRMLRQANDTR